MSYKIENIPQFGLILLEIDGDERYAEEIRNDDADDMYILSDDGEGSIEVLIPKHKQNTALWYYH